MGNNFSNRADVYINEFSNPKVKESQQTIHIRGIVIPGETFLLFGEEGKRFINPFADLVSSRDEEHSVIVLGIHLLFVDNPTRHDLRINVTNLFAGTGINKDVPHIDDLGSLVIMCPAKYSGTVNGNDRIVYKPRMKDVFLREYAGMEEEIIEANGNSVDLPDRHYFHITHPIVVFIIKNREVLEPGNSDFYRNKESDTYSISDAFLQRVKTFFKLTYYNDIHKTRFVDTKVECNLPKELYEEMIGRKNDAFVPNVSLIVQVNYLSILPGEEKMRHIEMRV
jgi:hypothetical protein